MLLNQFESTMTMENKIGVVIPQGLAGSKYFTNEFSNVFNRMFGGSSMIEVNGLYTMEDGKTAHDNNLMVYAWYSEMNEKDEKEIAELIQLMKKVLKQECIGIEYNNQFTLVF